MVQFIADHRAVLAYFSQPILEGDRSLFSPVPSPLVPRQRGHSANSLGKWHARQDSNP